MLICFKSKEFYARPNFLTLKLCNVLRINNYAYYRALKNAVVLGELLRGENNGVPLNFQTPKTTVGFFKSNGTSSLTG